MIKLNQISFVNLNLQNCEKSRLSFKVCFIPPKFTNIQRDTAIFTKCKQGNSLPDFLKWIEEVNSLSDKTLTEAFGGTGVKVSFEFFEKVTGMGRKKVKKWFVKMILTASEQDKSLLSAFSDPGLKKRVVLYDGKTAVHLKPKKVEGNFTKTLRKQLLELNIRWKRITEENQKKN
jgi:hypothetical protein